MAQGAPNQAEIESMETLVRQVTPAIVMRLLTLGLERRT
jgi:hypothetical protein